MIEERVPVDKFVQCCAWCSWGTMLCNSTAPLGTALYEAQWRWRQARHHGSRVATTCTRCTKSSATVTTQCLTVGCYRQSRSLLLEAPIGVCNWERHCGAGEQQFVSTYTFTHISLTISLKAICQPVDISDIATKCVQCPQQCYWSGLAATAIETLHKTLGVYISTWTFVVSSELADCDFNIIFSVDAHGKLIAQYVDSDNNNIGDDQHSSITRKLVIQTTTLCPWITTMTPRVISTKPQEPPPQEPLLRAPRLMAFNYIRRTWICRPLEAAWLVWRR